MEESFGQLAHHENLKVIAAICVLQLTVLFNNLIVHRVIGDQNCGDGNLALLLVKKALQIAFVTVLMQKCVCEQMKVYTWLLTLIIVLNELILLIKE